MYNLDFLDGETLVIAICVMLAGYFCAEVLFRLRLRREEAQEKLRQQADPGHGIDVSRIAPLIRRVRENHASALHHPAQLFSPKAELVAASRRLIARMAFFHRTQVEAEADRNDV